MDLWFLYIYSNFYFSKDGGSLRDLVKPTQEPSAQKYIDGEFTIIQDADLEYDPNDYFLLLEYIQANKLKILYGSRVLEHKDREKIQNFTQFHMACLLFWFICR